MTKILILAGEEGEKELLRLLSLINITEKLDATIVLLKREEPHFSEEMFKQECLAIEKMRPNKYDKIFGRPRGIPKVPNIRANVPKRVFRPRR